MSGTAPRCVVQCLATSVAQRDWVPAAQLPSTFSWLPCLLSLTCPCPHWCYLGSPLKPTICTQILVPGSSPGKLIPTQQSMGRVHSQKREQH